MCVPPPRQLQNIFAIETLRHSYNRVALRPRNLTRPTRRNALAAGTGSTDDTLGRRRWTDKRAPGISEATTCSLELDQPEWTLEIRRRSVQRCHRDEFQWGNPGALPDR